MKRSAVSLIALAMVLLAGCQDINVTLPTLPDSSVPPITVEPGADVVADNYLVVLREDAAAGAVADVLQQVLGIVNSGGSGSFGNVETFQHAISGFVAQLGSNDISRLLLDPRVKYIEPDYRVQLGNMGLQYYSGSSQVVPWGVKKVGGSRDGSGRVAWILDTGIDLYNSDLNVDRRLSRNFVRDGRSATDGNGHGTHVAGTIGAKNNGVGVVGVAANATLVAVRVLDDRGSGSYSSIIAGIDYAAANGRPGDVINLSLGGPASRALDEAVARAAGKGLKVVIAAGNSGVNAYRTSPARVNYPNVYTVSAIDNAGRMASFSNYGASVDVAAPGVSILSSRVGGGTVYMSGTSMAAPHVAGLLLFGQVRGNGYAQHDPDGTPDPVAYK